MCSLFGKFIFLASMLAHGVTVTPNVLSYPGESITWTPCGEAENHTLECSSIDVPMDQFNVLSPGNQTFNIPLIRLRGRDAPEGRNLIVNPGGPGGSGLQYIYLKGAELNAIVGEGYHLVSFDPRGVNTSRPLASCYPDSQSRQRLSQVRNVDPVLDSGEIFAWADNYAQACADVMGEHGIYINTPQTAADMNSILDALGQDSMAYWGFSYGSLLGQTYAALFPERSERIIVDGIINIFNWYNGTVDHEMWTDTDTVFDGFFDECIKAGENCALSEFGMGSKEVLKKRVMDLGDQLKDQPESAYINSARYGLIDYQNLFHDAIFPVLFNPASWYSFSQILASFMNGNATTMFSVFGSDSSYTATDDANSIVHLNDAQTGPEYWPQDRKSFLDIILPGINSSKWAMIENVEYYKRQKWQLPKTHTFLPTREIATAHPILILSTTYDPVCPLKSARVARNAFKDSRIIEVKGYGHCSNSLPSSCLTAHVRDFLYNGTLPEKDVQCASEMEYFKPPTKRNISPQINAEDDLRNDLYIAHLRRKSRVW
ncbi:unnamed protein product [Clonostachys rosea f. rosea IK726]|uniref:AB hydrolase-1 domain-containing protein n=2 Tax=Bionectria ochroleuca TaxID=29856 RepID=A0A0B7KNN9_BIOOC|nr:unnamed protein product [Clonostachys rosea f. rosea IK726]